MVYVYIYIIISNKNTLQNGQIKLIMYHITYIAIEFTWDFRWIKKKDFMDLARGTKH